jgi:hypothetical protein
LSVTDISTDHHAYAARRARERSRMIPIRAQRRVRVGDMLLFEFEDEQTLRYQVQEMVYTERLADVGAVAHEVEAYARLLPSSHALSVTMFIELNDQDAVRDELARLHGIQDAVSLEIGGVTVPGMEVRGLDDDTDGPSETVSVHMLRFPLDDGQRDAFRDPEVPVELVVDHPAYSESAPVAGATRLRLIADLSPRS